MNLPYGMSNFAAIRRGQYFYADKTRFIPRLEDARKGRRYLSFFRPRRFGKSTLVSMLEHYYDVLHAPRFEELFGGLAIAREPTADRGSYIVLRLEFTGITTDEGIDRIRADFFSRLHNAIQDLLARYGALLADAAAGFEAGMSTEAPATLMQRFLQAMRQSPYPLYVLIDEYDNFANDIIGRGADNVYSDIILAGGFVREFYKTLKEGTATGVIGRLFMTGVTPIPLYDMSSGFNIINHLSRDQDVHDLCGLSASEVAGLLDSVVATGAYALSRDEVMADLARYYDGYLFHEDAGERLYNPDMVLYFLQGLNPPAKYPRELLDPNMRIDYGRLDSLFFAAGHKPRRHPIELIRSVVASGHVDAELYNLFPLAEAHSERFFASYLYYLGFLTIERRNQQWLRMVIPNYVIERLYGEALHYILEQSFRVEILPDPIKGAVGAMAFQGDIEPFLRLLGTEVLSRLSNRDLIRMDEKSIKLLMLGFLSLSDVFLPFSEFEAAQGYSDLILTLNKGYPDALYSFLIELKYIKSAEERAQAKGPATPQAAKARGSVKGSGKTARTAAKGERSQVLDRVEAAMQQGEQQLAQYRSDPRLGAVAGQGGWKAVTVVFVGTKSIYFREIGQKTHKVAAAHGSASG